MFNWVDRSVDYIADRLNNVVQKTFNDVYSTRLQKIEHRQIVANTQLADILKVLNSLVGANTSPRTPGVLESEEVRRYISRVNDNIGGVVEGLPEPPAALTGRRRGNAG